ncbi:quinone oxidoreductase family protein [Microvirga brassicacearum]|uniref:NADP-dependent oxidoreductase n=1 Tax=Microvirga brassicacearum TaxID=2580413 RepID=A0A5N3P5Z0_9HYPH|nr:NADP-dependent oxidoreductase [Microvirga brassicacearum]KAB0265140.1 NADP-dependent oxidoreductase [Microvirga brassicacearum]
MTEPFADQAVNASSKVQSGKAVTYKALGGYDVIEIVDRAVRPPEAGEVRIAVKAAAVNPADVALRDPGYSDPPMIPGMDAAGIVEALGPDVSRLRVGDEVMAVVEPVRPDGGAQAAHIVVPAASVVPIPQGVSLAEASTLPMNGLTALRALELAALAPGQTLAVSGGAGLLAHYAIAAAKHQGLRVVADAKREETELVRGYGADVVVERGDDFAGTVRREVPEGVDALLDTALLLEKAFPAIRDGGVYIPVRGWGDTPSERGIQIKPVWVAEALERTDMLELLRDLAESGAIKLRVTGEYAPEQVADAQRVLTTGGLRGRPVIVF